MENGFDISDIDAARGVVGLPLSRGVPDPEVWTGPLRHNQPISGSVMPDKAKFDVSPSGALKDVAGKPRLDLVPFEFIEGAARAFTYGAEKYDTHNWRKGMTVSKIVRSLLNHICRWWMLGEDYDKESGVHHLDHASANLAMLMSTLVDQPHLNDRFQRPQPAKVPLDTNSG